MRVRRVGSWCVGMLVRMWTPRAFLQSSLAINASILNVCIL